VFQSVVGVQRAKNHVRVIFQELKTIRVIDNVPQHEGCALLEFRIWSLNYVDLEIRLQRLVVEG